MNIEISNPAGHKHRPTTINGQTTCQDCGEVLINPILSFDDERLSGTATQGLSAEEIAYAILGTDEEKVEALKLMCPCRLDLLLIELCERTNHNWPDYIAQLADFTKGENPPHLNDMALGKVD